MSFSNILQSKNLILASGSPRRKALMLELGLEFEIQIKEVKEVYPKKLKKQEISEFLAKLKAKPFENNLRNDDILITADTIVWFDERALGKPKSREEAIEMLQSLSGKTHEVISSVALTTSAKQTVISDITEVSFKKLSIEEIVFYVDNYKPFDKAGGYGIQEWIGHIGIERIEGNYQNVVGFPVQKFFSALLDLSSFQNQ